MSYKLIKIKQNFKSPEVINVVEKIKNEFQKSNIRIEKNFNIAIAVGSRGITNLPLIVKSVINYIKEKGGNPFIVPAMGSHGGANANGQVEVLESLGISSESMECSIKSSMETVELINEGFENVFVDKYAYESDGIILINRIKPHTDFHDKYESGIAKMAVIGLGKHKQALIIHRLGVQGLKKSIPVAAKKIFNFSKILLGIAIVENAYDETIIIKALKPEEILEKEPELLEIAKQNMPSLPTDNIDVLIIDRQGKDLSGTGVDPNIIGRIKIRGQKEPEKPKIKNIVITDISEASHGNAVGVGFADVITRNLFNKIDFKATYENVITATFTERAKIPIIAETSEEAFNIALRCCGYIEKGKERVVRIKDTLNLEEVFVSKAILDDIKEKVEIIGDFKSIFCENGQMLQYENNLNNFKITEELNKLIIE